MTPLARSEMFLLPFLLVFSGFGDDSNNKCLFHFLNPPHLNASSACVFIRRYLTIKTLLCIRRPNVFEHRRGQISAVSMGSRRKLLTARIKIISEMTEATRPTRGLEEEEAEVHDPPAPRTDVTPAQQRRSSIVDSCAGFLSSDQTGCDNPSAKMPF